jgi:outer membrane immunogenic protein
MRSRLLLASAAIAASAAAPALAADIGAMEPPPVPEYTAPVEAAPTWSGFYLGALFGYTWANADSDAGDSDGNGIDGGAFAGYNWQMNNFVVGAEADVLASGVEGDEGDFDADQGINGSLRARAGIALDQFLLYGTGGVAMTKLEVDDGTDSDDQSLVGWTAGVGGEALITQNITARVEYRYTDYAEQEFSLGGGDTDVDLNTHSVRAGVGFKF